MSGGAIAGIVIGVVAGVALVALAAVILFRRRMQTQVITFMAERLCQTQDV